MAADDSSTQAIPYAPATVLDDEKLSEQPVQSAIRRRRRRRIVALVAGLFLIVFAAVVADGYLQALRYGRDLRALSPRLKQARADLLTADGTTQIRRTVSDAELLREEVVHSRFTFGMTGMIPFLGRPIDAVRLSAEAAHEGAQALGIAQGLVDDVTGNGSGGAGLLANGRINLPLLRGMASHIDALLGHLEAGERDLRAIPHIPFLGEVDRQKSEALTDLHAAVASARRAASAARLMPALFGASGPRTYFLALQNNADLRATGGAVLAWGIVRIDAAGRISLVDGGPVGDLDSLRSIPVPVPPGIEWYHSATGRPMIMNNGFNYSPDFPLVAESWARAVTYLRHIPIDGVIALDPFGVKALMAGQKPVELGSTHILLDPSNIPTFTEHDQYSLPADAQKELPKQLIHGAFKALSGSGDVLQMTTAVSQAIADKRIQMWSRDPAAAQLLDEMGWSAAIQSGPGDYLYLTDNKRNVNKVDYFSDVSIDDHVRIDPEGAAHSIVKITLANNTPPGENVFVAGPWKRYALNVAMLSLHVPLGARNVSVTPTPAISIKARPRQFVSHVEADRRVFTKIIEAWPGHPGVLTMSYETPGVIQNAPEGKLYELVVQHQPLANPAHLAVTLTLPAGATIIDASAGWTVHGAEATFQGDLTRDFVPSVLYRLPDRSRG